MFFSSVVFCIYFRCMLSASFDEKKSLVHKIQASPHTHFNCCVFFESVSSGLSSLYIHWISVFSILVFTQKQHRTFIESETQKLTEMSTEKIYADFSENKTGINLFLNCSKLHNSPPSLIRPSSLLVHHSTHTYHVLCCFVKLSCKQSNRI